LSNTTVNTRSRRETHKTRTRSTLREAALELFASRGYDTTTVEEIAEKAGVSARTFFRYFPTKDTVLFLSRGDWVRSVASAHLEQSVSMSDARALTASFVEVGSGLAQRRDSLLLYERAVASSPTLRGCEVDRKRVDTATIAGAIAARRGRQWPDEDCNLLAEVGLLTHHRALDRWLAGAPTADLRAMISDEFQRLTDILAGA
jgi:AcrR family transcriptional regulator